MRPCTDCGEYPGHDGDCPALRRERDDGPPYDDTPDYGGAFDGTTVTSDADPGL